MDHAGVSTPIPQLYRIYGWMTLRKMWVPICLYCSNCTKFGQFILRKIIKIVATRCQILRLKCTKFDFGWGSAPDPAGGAYSAPQTPSWIWGPTSMGQGRIGEGREGLKPPKVNFLVTSLHTAPLSDHNVLPWGEKFSTRLMQECEWEKESDKKAESCYRDARIAPAVAARRVFPWCSWLSPWPSHYTLQQNTIFFPAECRQFGNPPSGGLK